MFRDRLASEEHVQQFEAILKQTMRKYFGKEVRAVNPTKNQAYTEFCFQKIYFVPKSPKSQGQLHGLTHDEWLEEVQRQITICSELMRHYRTICGLTRSIVCVVRLTPVSRASKLKLYIAPEQEEEDNFEWPYSLYIYVCVFMCRLRG